MRSLLTFLIGAVFGTGIVLSGMANPAKVVNFFDIFGSWDPSLAFVMGGAVVTTFFGYRLVLRRTAPIFERSFDVPTNHKIDARLITGSGVFGIGWGIAGFCPGGALPALGTLDGNVIAFVIALIVGILGARAFLGKWEVRKLHKEQVQ